MKPGLQLKLSQHLALTPQLQQSIKLLQLSTIELEQEIENYLAENPLLERDDDGDGAPPAENGGLAADWNESAGKGETSDRNEASDTGHDEPAAAETDIERDFQHDAEWTDDWSLESGGAYPSASATDDDETEAQDLQPVTTSLRDHLVWQLNLTQLTPRDRQLVRILIEALDEDGYLSSPLEELAEALHEQGGEAPDADEEDAPSLLEELTLALKHLQQFDPLGVGARDIRECLRIQALALPAAAERDLALRIVAQHLDLLANRDFVRLRKATGESDEALKAAQDLIRSLNPRPGAQYATLDTRYIVPDVIVRKLRTRWVASINPDAYPKLRVNRLYAEILQKQRRGEGGALSGQLQEARWLIKNVQQRFDTIQRVTQAIVDRQRQFFEHGEVAMRPLVLREIAEECDLHESTISRVTSQKYMATPRGIFELKYFFGSHVATEAGGACSATAIRALIKQLVSAENPKKPLSDNQIADMLGEQGIVVARRTIAKYRESLNIPAANLRKSL